MKTLNIPVRTAVHTSTEEEAKELLSILHESGYKWETNESLLEKDFCFHVYGIDTVYIIKPSKRCVSISSFKYEESWAISFLEFKKEYTPKWANEPKTWDEMVKQDKATPWAICSGGDDKPYTPIEKSALALLKIHELIEVGYGGNVSNKEINSLTVAINSYGEIVLNDEVEIDIRAFRPLLFRSYTAANEFLFHNDNRKLLETFYMV